VKSVVSNSEFKLGIDMGEITVRLPLGQQIRQPGQETAVLQEAIAKCGDYDYYFQKDCSCYRGIARHWRATALALAKAGVRMMIHYGRSASEAKALQKRDRRRPGRYCIR
jgi:hypothetical protein